MAHVHFASWLRSVSSDRVTVGKVGSSSTRTCRRSMRFNFFKLLTRRKMVRPFLR